MVWSMSLEFHRLDDDIFYCDGMNCYTMEDTVYPLKEIKNPLSFESGFFIFKVYKKFQKMVERWIYKSCQRWYNKEVMILYVRGISDL